MDPEQEAQERSRFGEGGLDKNTVECKGKTV